MEIISEVRAPGKSVYEDGILIIEDKSDINIFIFDGRRAWQESGDAERLCADFGAESTGQAATYFFIKELKKCMYLMTDQLSSSFGEVLKRHGYDLSRSEGLPGCAAATVLISKYSMSFSNLCDTKIILFNKQGEFSIPTIDNMDHFDRKVFRLAAKNAEILGITPRVAMWEVDYSKHPDLIDPKFLDYENRKLENINIRAAIGVLNGMPNASRFQQNQSFFIGPYDYILICTDGLSFPCGVDEPVPWQDMIFFLLQNNFDLELLVQEIRRREDDDKEFIKYPRFAYHRDATGVLIEV
ncbi:hypothetical protein KAS41_02130 [Candidatus Parcubacteria bacterium]|nr:hypothetical protein [Candidatus Parcubacteria bacterium]